MNIHYFQHVPFEGLGSIEPWAHGAGHDVSVTRFFLGETSPPLATLDLLVVMGGPMGVYDEREFPWLAAEKRYLEQVIEQQKRVLGICLGAQLLADVLGARVYRNKVKEIGWFPIYRVGESAETNLAGCFPRQLDAFHWHGDTFDLPSGAVHLARSAACENQAFQFGQRVVALQFHLETTRAGVESLVANCGGELVEAPWVQLAAQMLSDDTRFGTIHGVMRRLLAALTGPIASAIR